MKHLIDSLRAEAKIFEKKVQQTGGSDRKKYRALAGMARDVAGRVEAAYAESMAKPVLDLLTVEACHRLVATAREADKGAGQCFIEALRQYLFICEEAERKHFNGALYTQIAGQFLVKIPWEYIGVRIEAVVGEADTIGPIPVQCPQCKEKSNIQPQAVTNGYSMRCLSCNTSGPVGATIPQASLKWNEQCKGGK